MSASRPASISVNSAVLGAGPSKTAVEEMASDVPGSESSSCRNAASKGLMRSTASQLPLEDLVGGVLGQCVAELHRPGVLVRGDPLLDVLDELGLRGYPTGPQRDVCLHLLPEPGVRDADDGGFGDGRVGVQDVLDLAGVDVVAAADDEVLLAVDDEHEAVLVDEAEVAGVQPAVDDGLGGGRRVVVVAAHH